MPHAEPLKVQRGEANVISAENGDFRKETRSSSQNSANSDASVLRAKIVLASPSANPCESVKSVDQNLHVTTNEVFDFSAPEGACLATNWLIRGAATDAPCLTGVLKIRDPLAYSQSVYLRVPTGSPNCCPCPEHATNKIFGAESSNFGGA